MKKCTHPTLLVGMEGVGSSVFDDNLPVFSETFLAFPMPMNVPDTLSMESIVLMFVMTLLLCFMLVFRIYIHHLVVTRSADNIEESSNKMFHPSMMTLPILSSPIEHNFEEGYQILE